MEDAEERGNDCWRGVLELVRGMRVATQVEGWASPQRPQVCPGPQEGQRRIKACRTGCH